MKADVAMQGDSEGQARDSCDVPGNGEGLDDSRHRLRQEARPPAVASQHGLRGRAGAAPKLLKEASLPAVASQCAL